MNAELIIFDLDGTLVNSIPDLTDSLNHVCMLNHKPAINEINVTKMVGGGIDNLIEKAFCISNSDDNFNTYFSEFINHYNANCSNRSHLYKNVIKTLEHFKAKKLAILSNKVNYLTNKVVYDLKIANYFDIIAGATDGIAKKPSQEPINNILNKLNVVASNAVMVGDSEPDIASAWNAGIKSVAVTYGYRSKAQLENQNPDYIINDVYELTSIIY